MALALRLAAHGVSAERHGHPGVVLLDDVFSELDASRARALIGALPEAQTVLTTATGSLPDGIRPELVYDVRDGGVTARDVRS